MICAKIVKLSFDTWLLSIDAIEELGGCTLSQLSDRVELSFLGSKL